MLLTVRAASSIASALASLRVALLLGGALLLAESAVLATTLFAGAGISFAASLLIGASIYRYRAPRPVDAEGGPASSDAAGLAPTGSRPRPAKAVVARA
jgi:hypothetical protein